MKPIVRMATEEGKSLVQRYCKQIKPVITTPNSKYATKYIEYPNALETVWRRKKIPKTPESLKRAPFIQESRWCLLEDGTIQTRHLGGSGFSEMTKTSKPHQTVTGWFHNTLAQYTEVVAKKRKNPVSGRVTSTHITLRGDHFTKTAPFEPEKYNQLRITLPPGLTAKPLLEGESIPDKLLNQVWVNGKRLSDRSPETIAWLQERLKEARTLLSGRPLRLPESPGSGNPLVDIFRHLGWTDSADLLQAAERYHIARNVKTSAS